MALNPEIAPARIYIHVYGRSDMSLHGNWSYPTTVRFGEGRINEIAVACADAGITKPLLVTDRGLANMDITRMEATMV